MIKEPRSGFGRFVILGPVSAASLFSLSAERERAVDWPVFLSRHDMVFDSLPGNWTEATHLGNGMIGSMLHHEGEQAYFLYLPSKYISEDGQTLWLAYSTNFSPGWNGVDLKINPPCGRYGLSVHELKLMDAKP